MAIVTPTALERSVQHRLTATQVNKQYRNIVLSTSNCLLCVSALPINYLVLWDFFEART